MTDDETKVALETIFQSHEPWNSDQKQSVEKFSAALDPWLKLNGFPDSERATRIHDEFVDLSAISTLFSLRTPTNEGPGFVLLIVDNCRDNPFIDPTTRAFKFMGKRGHLGLPGVFWGSQIVIYSTTGTQTALDGTGRNSLFAAALKRRIARPLQTLTEMMAAVSEDVRTQSNERQGPEGPISLYMDPSRLCVVSCPPLPPRAPDGE
ncbi:MAG: caspase family protein [Acidobacteria bacterium]|nr:caspase family protein [Acidobacteriota bacterium]